MRRTIEVDIEGQGPKYDVYISHEGSSGSHYPEATAGQVGDYVADLIDCLQESESGQSYLHPKYILCFTDGYGIECTQYDSKEESEEAMQTAYTEAMPPSLDESFAEMSMCNDSDAILYRNGEDVYVWKIVPMR